MAIISTLLSGVTPDTVYQSVNQTAVTTMYFCNKSPMQATINIHLVPSGGTAVDDNLVYYALQIAANDTYVMDTERLIFDNGDAIICESSFPDIIVATVSYVGV